MVYLFGEISNIVIIYFRRKFKCVGYIGNERRIISYNELTKSPQFLRFRVKLDYQNIRRAIPIAEKSQSVVNYLQQIKLDNSSLIHFNATINKNNRSQFSDHSQLLDHLRNELLPICGSSRGYKFKISCFSDKASHKNLIAEILQIPRIDCCSNVEINLPVFTTHKLPIESISHWLHRNCDGIVEVEKLKEQFLRIYSVNSPCAQELCEYFKKVTFVQFFENFLVPTVEI